MEPVLRKWCGFFFADSVEPSVFRNFDILTFQLSQIDISLLFYTNTLYL